MRIIISDKSYEVSLVSMNKKNKSCRVKIHYFGDDFAYVREYSLDYDFGYYSLYATQNDWKNFFRCSSPLCEVYVKSIKMF